MVDVLVIDNYDSFVYNLARYVRELGRSASIVRNDAVTCEEILEQPPRAIILSPGPCTPDEAGISLELIQRASGVVPILGICLGHQAIGQAFGGKVVQDAEPTHGRSSWVEHAGTRLFEGVPSPFEAGRYHSLIVDPDTLPGCLQVTARTSGRAPVIMALEHLSHPTFGWQFHPESILTPHGYELLRNFLNLDT